MKLSKKTVDDTAVKIARLHGEIVTEYRTTLEKVRAIGEMLDRKKAEIGHGEFLPWIAKNLPFSLRAAQRYMAAFKNKNEFKCDSVAYLVESHRILAEPQISTESRLVDDLRNLRDSGSPVQGRFLFGEMPDGVAVETPAAGMVRIGTRGEWRYIIEHAEADRFHVARVCIDGDASIIDAAYRPLTAAGVGSFIVKLGDSLDGITWGDFAQFGEPTRLNPWMFGPKDSRARAAA